MIIGITGTLGAGKGTVVEYLKTKGFKHFSASGFIKEEILKRGLPVNRDTMNMVGNDLRAQFGPGYVVASLRERAEKEGGDVVIEALHTPGEAAKLQEQGAAIFAVDANPKIRYERIVKRGSEKDHVSFEKFLEQEKLEMAATDPAKQNISAVVALADTTLTNDGTPEELFSQVEEALKKH